MDDQQCGHKTQTATMTWVCTRPAEGHPEGHHWYVRDTP